MPEPSSGLLKPELRSKLIVGYYIFCQTWLTETPLSKRVTNFNLFTDSAMRSGSIELKRFADKSRFSMMQSSESIDSSNCLTWSAVSPVLARFNFLVFTTALANSPILWAIASRESQLWRGTFPMESWQEQADPAEGQQLQTFSRKSSRL